MTVLVLVAAFLLQSAVPAELRDGLLAMKGSDWVSAQRLLETAAKAAPENAVVWAALAQAYLHVGKRDPALHAAREAERLGAAEPAIEHALAMFYAAAGEPARAAGLERRYAGSPGADGDAFTRAAALYLDGGDNQGAIEAAKAGLAGNDRAALHSLLGKAYAAEGNRALALSELRAAARLAPDDAEAAFALGEELLRGEDFAGASEFLAGAAQRFPAQAQIVLALGVADYGLRRFPEAIAAFLRTIELAPDVEQPYVFLGRMLDQAGTELPRIQARFEAFRARNAASYLGSFLVAKALLLAGDAPERAETLLREAISRREDFWEAHAELGDVLARKKDYRGAAGEYARAADLNPAEASIHFRLARVYDRLQEPAKAQAERALHQKLSAQAGRDAKPQ